MLEIDEKTLCRIVQESANSAKKNDNTLERCINKVIEMANNYNAKLKIINDFEEHSFMFYLLDNKDELIMNGGIIFHGFKGETDNSFSCTIERVHGWEIHT